MQVDYTLAIAVIVAIFSFLAYLLRYMAVGIKCLIELKATVEVIKDNQKEIKDDFKIL